MPQLKAAAALNFPLLVIETSPFAGLLKIKNSRTQH